MPVSRSLAAVVAAAALAGCQMAPATPDPTGRANADMLRVLAAYQASGAKPVPMLSVEQARAQPTPGDAATAVGVQLGLPAKLPLAQVTDIQVGGVVVPAGPRAGDAPPARLVDARTATDVSGPVAVSASEEQPIASRAGRDR